MGKLLVGSYEGVAYASGIIRLLGTKLQTYVYATDGLLVDTGPSKLGRELAGFFQSHSIKQAVLTHFHEDHSGNAPLLEKNGVEVHIHPGAVTLCQKSAWLPFYRYLFWGSRKRFNPSPLGQTLETEHKVFHVLEVPGHSFDHIALYDPSEGAIFTGDLYVHFKTRVIMKQENITQIMQSLRVLLQHDFKTLFCGHAGVVQDGRKMVQMKLENLENLQGEVLNLHSKGYSIREINKSIFPKTPSITYVSGKEWASEHIIRSILAKK